MGYTGVSSLRDKDRCQEFYISLRDAVNPLRCAVPASRASQDSPMYIHERMKYVRVFSLVMFTLLGLTGCAGMSPVDNAKFQAVVAKNVSVGMSFVMAIEHLVKAGFSCDDRSAAPAVTCTRNRMSLLPYACVQRVNLITDSDRKTITEVIPKPIACAGLLLAEAG